MSDQTASTAYPKWQYHATEPAKMVNSADEEKKLGPGWFDNPAQAVPKATAKKADEEKPEVKAKAAS